MVTVPADDSYRDAASDIPFDRRPIVAAVQIDANLPGFARVESPREVRSVVSRLDPNINDPIPGTDHGRLIVGVCAVYVGYCPQLAVIAIGRAAQPVSSRLELGRKPACAVRILRRQV